MKKYFSCLLVLLVLVLPMLGMEADAAETVASGSCGENLTWTLDDAGTLTISGTGGMTYYSSYSDIPWYSQRESILSIVVEEGITSIDVGVFSGCSSLESMTIPFVGRSVKTATDTYQYPLGYIFGERSYTGGTGSQQYFYGSSTSSTTYATYYIPSSLKSVTVTGGNILRGAFYNCGNLTSITLPDSVTSIGDCAFLGCTNLSSITLPDSVTSIGDYAFYNCTSLSSITLPASLASIGGYTFYNCDSLNRITLPAGITSIGNYTFYSCDILSSITIPEGVTSIGSNAFSGCNSLSRVNITDIGAWCQINFENYTSNPLYYADDGLYLNGAPITAAVLPDSVTSIPDYAFRNCMSLSSITIPEGVTSIGGSAFSDCTSLSSITLPEGVTSIGNYAFSDCTSLESITIPASVTSIGNYAFSDCTSLSKVEITDVAAWCSINFTDYDSNPLYYADNGLYLNGAPITAAVLPEGITSIPNYAFRNCKSLRSVTLPQTLTSIGSCAFRNCKSLRSVTLPQTLTSIGSYAFYNCEILRNITLPAGITSIGNYTFYSCDILSSITIPEGVTSIGDYAFSDCTSLSSITLPEGVTSIGSSVFLNCTSLSSITIPDSVTSIGSSVFRNCTSLSSITIPDSVTSIGSSVFRNCTSLSSITIPDSVTSIGDYTFDYCTSLSKVEITDIAAWCNISFGNSYSNPLYYADDGLYLNGELVADIVLPDSVTSIGDYAFYNCDSLSSITIPDSVTDIGNSAFYGCSSLTSVTMPETLYSLGSSAFANCVSLSSITIPEGVTTIGEETFYYCYSLTDIALPESILLIRKDAFSSCRNLDTVHYAGTEELQTELSILTGNTYLTGATWHYECDGVVCTNPPPTEPEVTDPKETDPEETKPEVTEPEETDPEETDPEETDPEETKPEATVVEVSLTFGDEEKATATYIDNSGNYEDADTSALDTTVATVEITAVTVSSEKTLTEGVTAIKSGKTYVLYNKSARKLMNNTWADASVGGGGTDGLALSSTTANFKDNDCWTITSTNGGHYVQDVNGKYLSITRGKATLKAAPVVINLEYDGTDWTIGENGEYLNNFGGADTAAAGWNDIYDPNSQWYIYEMVETKSEITEITFTAVGEGETSVKIGDVIYNIAVDAAEPEKTDPEETDPEETDPEETKPEVTEPEETKPEETDPEETNPEETDPEETDPEETKPQPKPTEPEVTKPTEPEGSKPTEPEVTKPTEPEVTKPTEPEVTKPTEPEDTKPTEPDEPKYENPFEDVFEADYYYDPVLWAVNEGITNGMDATHFAPAGTCTRAQIVTFLWRANGSPASGGTNPFTDVPADAWYTDAVLWAVENGITTGTSATTFSPDAGCTRGQVATFLWRSQGQPYSYGENIFTDIAPGAYYYDAILWAVEEGITNGMGEGLFAPDATCTRGQIVTFLYRAMA